VPVKVIPTTYIKFTVMKTVKFMKLLDNVAGTEATRNAYRILLVKPLGKMKLEKKIWG
jgi:hypothetical protein